MTTNATPNHVEFFTDPKSLQGAVAKTKPVKVPCSVAGTGKAEAKARTASKSGSLVLKMCCEKTK